MAGFAPEAAAPALSVSWRDRRRSRVAEVSDGARMMFSDVAVLRTLAVVAVMWAVAALARRKVGTWALALAFAAALYLFAEMVNTLVEMLVDRISLDAHRFSARIKHAAAFLSFVFGAAAFGLLLVVSGKLFFGTAATSAIAIAAAAAAAPPAPTSPPRRQPPSPRPAGIATRSDPLRGSGSARQLHHTAAREAPAVEREVREGGAEARAVTGEPPSPRPAGIATRSDPLRGSARQLHHTGEGAGPEHETLATHRGPPSVPGAHPAPLRQVNPAAQPGAAGEGGAGGEGGRRGARRTGGGGSGSWRSILHPVLWEDRVARRRRYRVARETSTD
jgi:diacylglycerol kinase